jgi:hypothetical protein
MSIFKESSETMVMKEGLADLSKEELLAVIEMFSSNWLTLDGLWFTLVEDKYGLEAALELDLKMWIQQASIEARRIKKYMSIEGEGVKGVLKALRFMTFDPAMPFDYLLDGVDPGTAYMWVPYCRPQEGRKKTSRGEFPCKDIGMACYENLAKIIDPSVKVECLFAPPDSHPADAWCKWKLTSTKS